MPLHPELGYFDEGLNLTDPSLYATALDVGEHSSILPPVAYRSRIFAELEDEKLWTRMWCCIGSTQQISMVGDLLPYTLGNHGIHVQRDKNGFSGRFNFAQHGGCRFVPAQCQTGKKTKCSYTSCGYSRDRDVLKTSDVDVDTPILRHFIGDIPERMLPVQVETWGGCIFVNVDQNSHTINHQLTSIAPEIGKSLDKTIDKHGFWTPLEGNWKVSLGCIFDEICRFGDLTLDNTFQTSESQVMHRRETHHVIGKGNTNSYENYILWIFPNLLITKLGPFITRIIVQPTGLDEGMARVRFSVIDKTICFGDDEIKEHENIWKKIISTASNGSKSKHQIYQKWGTPSSPETTNENLPKGPEGAGYYFQQYLVDRLLKEYTYVWNAPLYTDARR
ncbi:MAG: hypothetical protein CMM30_02580 [Rhodospirillaceae bacterium]|nr:hypothetical protein [Rhodospirillaceae bacterium]|tara:strand:+ start:14915 stop:16087 length:1173 start_codon:yes stop_codon:yes gene_type:complete